MSLTAIYQRNVDIIFLRLAVNL